HLPLAAIPLLTARDIGGDVSGEAALEGLHGAPRLTADLDLTDLRVGKTPYGRAHLHAACDGARARAEVAVEEGDGRGTLDGQAGLVWGARAFPAFDGRQPATVTLKASRLRLGILAPFVVQAVENLDGRLDADARVALAP